MYFAGKVAAKIAPRQKEWVKAIQRRVGMTASMLGNMKSVKMMGLGDILFDTLQSQRVRELDLSKRFRVMMMWRMLLCEFISVLIVLLTFGNPADKFSFRSWYRRTIRMLCDIRYPSFQGGRERPVSQQSFLILGHHLSLDFPG